mmetsp:Transcript_25829/g.39298  ORF Transcript_25829/g.39298 Transcript_25829/m.39298 type:complete len:302 (-) Transcript_25829:31-936(-)
MEADVAILVFLGELRSWRPWYNSIRVLDIVLVHRVVTPLFGTSLFHHGNSCNLQEEESCEGWRQPCSEHGVVLELQSTNRSQAGLRGPHQNFPKIVRMPAVSPEACGDVLSFVLGFVSESRLLRVCGGLAQEACEPGADEERIKKAQRRYVVAVVEQQHWQLDQEHPDGLHRPSAHEGQPATLQGVKSTVLPISENSAVQESAKSGHPDDGDQRSEELSRRSQLSVCHQSCGDYSEVSERTAEVVEGFAPVRQAMQEENSQLNAYRHKGEAPELERPTDAAEQHDGERVGDKPPDDELGHA